MIDATMYPNPNNKVIINPPPLYYPGPQRKQDVLFFKRNGPEIYFYLYESLLQDDNDLDNYTCAFRTAVLWCLEVPVDEVCRPIVYFSYF